MDRFRLLVAEFIGTFTLVFVGGGAICMDAASGGKVTLLGIAIAHGLALGLMVSNFGHISGGHFNPAVTFGFFFTKRFDLTKTLQYWVAQCLGAVVAALFLKLIFMGSGTDAKVHLGLPMFDPYGAPWFAPGRALMVEAILTFFLVTAVFATAVDERGAFKMFAGMGIGLTLTMSILVGGPLSGASLNPARSFGPALISWDFSYHWIYWVAPLLGGAFAASLYDVLYLRLQKKS
jgi:aquaporin Z